MRIGNVSDEPAQILEIVMPAGLERCVEQLPPILASRGSEWTKRYYPLVEDATGSRSRSGSPKGALCSTTSR